MNATLRIATAALVAAAASAAHAKPEPIPLKDMVRNPTIKGGRISPTGEYFAVIGPRDGQDVLIVMRTKDLSIVKINGLPDEKGVGVVYWDGPQRLVFGATRKIESLGDRPGLNGEWYAVNADGSEPRTLISYGGGGATDRGTAVSYNTIFQMRDASADTEGKILMQVSFGGSKDGAFSELVEVDTHSGKRKRLLRGPALNCNFALDPGYQARYATCYRELDGTKQAAKVFVREGNSWREVYDSEASGVVYAVTEVTADGRALAYEDDGKRPRALGWYGGDGTFKQIFRDKRVDAGELLYAFDGVTPIGVFSDPDYPSVAMIDREHPDAQLYKSLAASFPGKFVTFGSATEDGKQAIVVARSDRDPGSYYLYDRDTGQARFLLKALQWLDEDKLAEVRPVSLKARDGVELHGYLTIPGGVEDPKNLPMIVNPHGGPYGPRDVWGYSPDTQILANHGYLVLQVNFRGSGGYGEAFTELGYRQWGGTMQDDVTDATLWAVEQGYADRDRICIYGGSYGGYASLMGVAKEPDLYRCAAGNVGVYDMPMMYEEGDIQRRNSGQKFLRKVLGTDQADLKSRSPNHLASRIKASVFLSAGRTDDRAPEEHTHAMYEALKAAGNPVADEDYILQAREGHGFYNEDNKYNYYSKLLGFFDRNLSPTAEAKSTAPVATEGGE